MSDLQRDTVCGKTSRRDVLRTLLGIAAGLTFPTMQANGENARILERGIPRSGEMLPALGLGTWQSFDVGNNAAARTQAKEVLRLFAAVGGRVVDSSPMYGSAEAVVGELAAALGLDKKLFLATKVWTTGRDAGIRQMETSMRRMRASRIDLMQVHNLVDVDTHLRTLREWKQAGRIRYLGVTHYHSSAYPEIERLIRSEALDFVQINYSLAEREADSRLLPLAADTRTAVIVNRPFAKGELFSRVRGKPLPPWAAEFKIASWGQFFLKWILGHPAVTCVIPATRNPKHLADNMTAGAGALPDGPARSRMVAYLQQL